MSKKTLGPRPGDGWNTIYQSPKNYTYYDLFAPHEDIKKIAHFFHQHKVEKILDLGCGLGNNLFFLNSEGFSVTGLDAAESAIAQLKSKIKKQGLSIKAILGQFQNLPFNDQSFDAVISVQTLQHGYRKDIQKGIAEIERVLKPGGFIFVTLPGRIAKGKIRYCLVKTAKKVEDNTFLPIIGDEVGVPHFIYNKKLIHKYFGNFVFCDFWKDSRDYYCLLGQKKGEFTLSDV